MRRFYLYAVVGLFASLIWAGINQPSVSAAPVYSPVTQLADAVPWEPLQCGSDEDAIDIKTKAKIPVGVDINGSAILTDYIVCPIVVAMYAGIGLVVNAIEATGLLSIPPLLTNGQASAENQKGLFALWGVMRDFANIGLVIGLFMVVFSQATSYGLSAYGVKKMLPKIVIAALLINLSYIICAVLVDVFNILGTSLDDILQLSLDNALQGSATIGEMIGSNAAVIGLALAVGGPAGILIIASILTIVLFLLLLFGLMCIFFLVARQILVVCLVIAAPLAFIAWLFPNTEKYFQKWWSTLIKLLAIFPVVMCLKVVSYVIIIAIAALIGS